MAKKTLKLIAASLLMIGAVASTGAAHNIARQSLSVAVCCGSPVPPCPGSPGCPIPPK